MYAFYWYCERKYKAKLFIVHNPSIIRWGIPVQFYLCWNETKTKQNKQKKLNKELKTKTNKKQQNKGMFLLWFLKNFYKLNT